MGFPLKSDKWTTWKYFPQRATLSMEPPEWFMWKTPKIMNKSREILSDKPDSFCIIMLGWLQIVFDTRVMGYVFFNGLFYIYDSSPQFKQTTILPLTEFTQTFNSTGITQTYLLFLSPSPLHILSPIIRLWNAVIMWSSLYLYIHCLCYIVFFTSLCLHVIVLSFLCFSLRYK